MKKRNVKNKKSLFFLIPILIILYVASIYLIKEVLYYNSSLSFMKYVVFGSVAFIVIMIILFTLFGLKKSKKKKKHIAYYVVLILFVIVEVFIAFNISKVSNSISKVTDKYTTYSGSLIVLKDSSYDSVKDIKGEDIGMISDSKDVAGYVIAKEIIKDENIDEDSIVSYDTYPDMLTDLYDGKIAGAFVSSSYKTMFASNDDFDDIANKVKVITSKKKIVKKESSSGKTLTEPFTVLLMGVDSEEESLDNGDSLNGDSLMLITFNPSTMNATILSIPRDTYVPIACYKNNAKNKINAAAYGGAECMIETIEDLTDINIDYWVKINFKGVVKLVDALGGIEVDVPYAFCEQNSNREFGSSTIYVEEGLQTLNGEQTLAFARNRHTWPQYCGKKYSNYTSNDFIRGQNQQLIVNAMLNKLKGINSLSSIYDILDVVGDSIDTNIGKEIMITGFDTFKNILVKSKNINSDDFIGTQRLYLSGYDSMMNSIYYYKYYEQSLNEVVDAMKINLELETPEMDKTFEFSINSPYESIQIGKGTYKY